MSTIISLSDFSHILDTTDPHVLMVWHPVFLFVTLVCVHLCAYHIWVEYHVLSYQVCICKYVL